MKRLALVLSVMVATNAVAGAPARGRGWLSGLGVTALGGAVAGVVLGINFELTAAHSTSLLAAYAPPTRDEAPAARILLDRRDSSLTYGLVSFIAGGLLLGGGVIALLVDAPVAETGVAFVPIRDGAMLGVSGRF